jgi:hypothetical protein
MLRRTISDRCPEASQTLQSLCPSFIWLLLLAQELL